MTQTDEEIYSTYFGVNKKYPHMWKAIKNRVMSCIKESRASGVEEIKRRFVEAWNTNDTGKMIAMIDSWKEELRRKESSVPSDKLTESSRCSDFPKGTFVASSKARSFSSHGSEME